MENEQMIFYHMIHVDLNDSTCFQISETII